MNTIQNKQAGFTLIELMIVVAIIGILASVAIGAYQTYTVRAQVAEGLSLVGPAKTSIVNSYLENGEAPADRSTAGMSNNATDTFGKYVLSVDIQDGRLEITYGHEAHSIIANSTLALTPYESRDGSVVWRCGFADEPTGSNTMGSGGNGLASTYESGDVATDYLPQSCR
ncbi:MAG: pilin [Gammaproteobacteria bacterium]